MSIRTALFATALLGSSALVPAPLLADEPISDARPASALPAEHDFRDPPASARPRVWWHWMNGNISKDGIAKDLAWMKRVGIGGLQNFDANLMTPQVVDKRLVYMTPEWKDAFRFAASEADRLGLEMAIASSPGWSETGGPWVKPEDGLKKLVWRETEIVGGRRFSGRLAPPPAITGPFQSIPMAGESIAQALGGETRVAPTHSGDVRVLAFPVPSVAPLVPVTVRDASGKTFSAGPLSDDRLATGIDMARSGATPGSNPMLFLDYGKPVTARTITLFAPGAAMMFVGALYTPRLEASDDGVNWRTVIDFKTAQTTATYAFPATTARWFRVDFRPRQDVGLNMGTPAPGIAMDTDIVEGMKKAFAGRPLTVGDLWLSGEPRIDRFEAKAGFAIEQDYFALPAIADRAKGITPGTVIDLTERMRPDGSLDWTPPPGRWKVMRLGYSLLGTTNHPAPPEATGLEVDKFDGAAVKRYLDHYIGMYRDAAGADLIGKRGVRALLTDSIEVGAANWTPRMIEQFKRLRGYDPVPWLPALTGTLVGSRADSDRFLYDYRRTLADLLASEHYGTVAKVAHENDLIVYGEALEDHRPSLGDDMAMRAHADVPMAAMWTHTRQAGPKLTYLADIKGAASVAHLYGRNLVAAESLTASMNPWNYAPRDLKRIIDLEFVTGVNRPVIHTSVHQPVDDKIPGISLFIFGQYFNRHETWGEMARPWVDYMARNSLLLQMGRNVADVAYFYGEEGPLTGLYGDKPVADAPIAHGYDFVNADVLANVLGNDGNMLAAPSGARYHVLYLGGSSRLMTLATLRRIAALVEGGATIVGLQPKASPSLSGSDSAGQAEFAALIARLWPAGGDARVGKGKVIATTDVEAALRSIAVAPDFTFSGATAGTELPFVHRSGADGDSYFVVNRGEAPVVGEARFRVQGKAPEIWHADTGKVEPIGYRIEGGSTVVPLRLDVDGSVHVVFRKPATGLALDIPQPALVPAGAIDGPWTVAFQPGRGAPATARFARLVPLDEHADPAIKYFSGVATYRSQFATPKGWKKGTPLWLDLGDVRELAEVSVNGRAAGQAWHAPYRIDIGSTARPGRNRIEVKVANLWVNRLIGDAQPGASKITWTAMPSYRADAPLRRSGLIGPVKLMQAIR